MHHLRKEVTSRIMTEHRFSLSHYIIVILITSGISILMFNQYIFGGAYYIASDAFSSDTIRIYIPTYYMMYDNLAEGWSWWSMQMGLGTSMMSHADVYFDPFTYILFIFGRTKIAAMVIYMVIAKILCSALTFKLYADYIGTKGWPSTIASVMYAFSGFAIIHGRNFVFSTIVIYLPLILLGIERYLSSKKKFLLILSLFLTAIYFYYFFYMIVIVVGIYVTVRYLQKNEFKLKSYFSYIWPFILMGLSSVLLSCFILLPNLIITQSNVRVTNSDVDLSQPFILGFNAFFTGILRMFTPDILGSPANYRGDYYEQSLFTSIIIFLVLPQLYNVSDKLKRKNIKVIVIILLIALLFPYVGIIFNGFSTISYRWSFIWHFVVSVGIALSLKEIFERKEINFKLLIISSILSVALIFISLIGKLLSTNELQLFFEVIATNGKMIFFAILVIGMFTVALLLGNKISKWNIKRGVLCFSVLILFIFSSEVLVGYKSWIGTMDSYQKSDEVHLGYFDNSNKVIKEIQERDDSFYRVNKTFDSVIDSSGIKSDNDPMIQKYFGLSNYNSAQNPNFVKFIQSMGIWVRCPVGDDPVGSPFDLVGPSLNYVNGVGNRYELMSYLGVKYCLTKDEEIPSKSFKLVGKDGDISVYENKDYFPLAYEKDIAVSYDQFLSLTNEEKDSIIIRAALIDQENLEISGMNLTEMGDLLNDPGMDGIDKISRRNRENVTVNYDTFKQDNIELSINDLKENSVIVFSIPYDSGWHVKANDTAIDTFIADGGMLAVKLPKGISNVQLNYLVPGMIPGIIISVITLICLIVFFIIKYIMKKRCKVLTAECENKKMAKVISSGRKSNIELLRIICMILLIAHHCVIHGGAINNEVGMNWFISWFLVPVGKICFVAFLAISSWFLVDKTFKSERFFKTWLQVLFYSLGGALLAFMLGAPMTWRNWFSAFLPITGNSHGFAAAYLAFYLTTPFLGMVAKKITKYQLIFLISILLYFQVFSKGVAFISQYAQILFSELQLFILIYFILLYFKKFGLGIFNSRVFNISVILVSWGILFILMCLRINTNNYIEFFFSINNDESGILYIISGCSLFFLFNSFNVPTIPWVNKVASTTFGILLIHDHNFLRISFWTQLLHVQDWHYSSNFILYLIITTIFVFTVCGIIDWLRQVLLERPIFKIKYLYKIFDKCDRILNQAKDS